LVLQIDFARFIGSQMFLNQVNAIDNRIKAEIYKEYWKPQF